MRKLIIAAAVAACGLGAAFALTARATTPPGIPDLPGLGYSLSMQFNAQTQCGNYVVVGGNGVDHEILIGDLPPRCSTAAQEQQRIDALLADFPPPGAAPVTTTVYGTTTEYVTTQADPVTTTVQSDPLPAVTVTEPAVTLPAETVTTQADPLPAVTVTLPAVTMPTVTVTVNHTDVQTLTETVTETVTEPTVTLAAPEIVAPWLVALSVRSAWLNLVYGLA